MEPTGISDIPAPTFVWNNRTDRDLTVYRYTSSDQVPTFPYRWRSAFSTFSIESEDGMSCNGLWYFHN
ncbi:hypothetical protein M514_25275 [Trichuris suis]|uniref:Uncharacterized protein n=1 Tax=Trichuris suis TaxID=68888 RepID=A0A085MZ93_9BILA|nr:hypothetical protein M514_25275 [Trichuris suis]